MKKSFTKIIASYLAFAMFIFGIVPKLEASFIASEPIMLSLDRSADLQTIQKALEQKIVRDRLEVLGFSDNEIQQRLGQLSDEQIHYLAQNIDQLNTGGDGLGIVIAVLVIAILVIILIKLTNREIVIK